MILRFNRTTNSEDSSCEGGSFDTVVFYTGAVIAAGVSIFLAVNFIFNDGKRDNQNLAGTLIGTSIMSIVIASIFFESIDQFGSSAFLRIRNKLSRQRFALMAVGFLTLIAASFVSLTFCWISSLIVETLPLQNFPYLLFVAILILFFSFVFATAIVIRLAARIVCRSAPHSQPRNIETN